MMTPKVYTVTQLNARVGALIASDPELQIVFIEGELSNVHMNLKSGHLYFSLKDKDSVIRAVMFSWAVRNLRFKPEDGMKVIMRAQVTVYEAGGQYQLRVEDMQPDGVGVLAMQLEQLKKKLGAQGLFDPEHKKPIPAIPETVGVITSPTGAALRDIMDIIGRRFPSVEIILAPVLVQGDGAPEQLIRAVKMFSEHHAADVLIIGRGGGSMEDLWAFNDEGLARAIYDCPIPVISAVGHESDTTIADYVADLRAPTPSAAAELAVFDYAVFANKMDTYRSRLTHAALQTVREKKDTLRTRSLRLAYLHPSTRIREMKKDLRQKADRLSADMKQVLEGASHKLALSAQRISSLSPQDKINQGYAFLAGKNGEPITDISKVHIGETMRAYVSDGWIEAQVTDVEKGKNYD